MPILYDECPVAFGEILQGPPGIGILEGAPVIHKSLGPGKVLGGWDVQGEAQFHRRVQFGNKVWTGSARELRLYLNNPQDIVYGLAAWEDMLATHSSAPTQLSVLMEYMSNHADVESALDTIQWAVMAADLPSYTETDAVRGDYRGYFKGTGVGMYKVLGLYYAKKYWVSIYRIRQDIEVGCQPTGLDAPEYETRNRAILDDGKMNNGSAIKIPGVATDNPSKAVLAVLTHLHERLPLNPIG